MNEHTKVSDGMVASMDRGRDERSGLSIMGTVHAVLTGPDGTVKGECTTHNLVTSVGDQMYAARGAGSTSPPASPTGMKLGAGSTAVSKSGAGAAIVTYLTGSNKAFTSTPTAAAGVATYTRTYAAGEATTAAPITEVSIVNDVISNDANGSTAANTISRALLAGIGSKGASDTLTVTWTHSILGA